MEEKWLVKMFPTQRVEKILYQKVGIRMWVAFIHLKRPVVRLVGMI